MASSLTTAVGTRNKVPQVTVEFWLIKLLAVTVGETAADYLALNLGYGLSSTTVIMASLLMAALALQFSYRAYVPWIYWVTVVLISVVGTLFSDNLVDQFGVPLETTTILFAVLLAATFYWWFRVEHTLSIHTIFTLSREAFYWLAVLFTFALGTSAGDLVAEQLGLGFAQAGVIFAATVGVIALFYYTLDIDPLVAFWMAYIFTRPVGASLGDFLAQPVEYGGLGLGTSVTSVGFLLAIGVLIGVLTIKKNHSESY